MRILATSTGTNSLGYEQGKRYKLELDGNSYKEKMALYVSAKNFLERYS